MIVEIVVEIASLKSFCLPFSLLSLLYPFISLLFYRAPITNEIALRLGHLLDYSLFHYQGCVGLTVPVRLQGKVFDPQMTRNSDPRKQQITLACIYGTYKNYYTHIISALYSSLHHKKQHPSKPSLLLKKFPLMSSSFRNSLFSFARLLANSGEG